MLKLIDSLLDRITMYRLVLYYLIFLWLAAVVLSLFGALPFSVLHLLYSLAVILAASIVANEVFARVFQVHANVESVYITALILALIISPAKSVTDFSYFMFLLWVGVLSQASKYILAIGRKHVFNPAAFAVAITALTLNQSATWWVGTAALAPFVAAGGLLVARKMRRFDLVLVFFAAALFSIIGFSLARGFTLSQTLKKTFLDTAILFFGFIMLTEPLTTPPTKTLRLWYGALVGLLFAPQVHVVSVYSTPELALLAGNIFSYIVSPKTKLLLKLKTKLQLATDTYEFIFLPDRQLNFLPGQYMEWTLSQKNSDSRGNRRYFTIASSPTEPQLRLGVKFYPRSSSFKKTLSQMQPNQTVVAGQLAGDFTMPVNKSKKLAFLAGGIGITPFASMLKYLVDKNERRDIVLFYSNRSPGDIAYQQLLDQAKQKLGIKTVYTVTDQPVAAGWNGKTGFIDGQMVTEQAPDYQERIFYVSGPQAMVTALGHMLRELGVPKSQIKKDFFPGFV